MQRPVLTTEQLLGLLVEVRDSDACSQGGIVRMSGGHGGSCLSCQGVQFCGSYSRVDPANYLHGNGGLRIGEQR